MCLQCSTIWCLMLVQCNAKQWCSMHLLMRCQRSSVAGYRWPSPPPPTAAITILFFLLCCYYYSFCYSFAIILAAIAMLLQLCPAGCSSCANIIFPYSQVYKEGGLLCFVLGCFIDLLCKALYMLVYHAVPYAFHCFS